LYKTINDNSEEFFGVLRFPSSTEQSNTKLDTDLQRVNAHINDKEVSK